MNTLTWMHGGAFTAPIPFAKPVVVSVPVLNLKFPVRQSDETNRSKIDEISQKVHSANFRQIS